MNGALVETVRRARELLGLDYREVARALQVHQSTLYRWRTGETSVSDRGRHRSASLAHFLDEIERAFPEPDSRMEWLDSPLKGFSGSTPRQFLHAGRADLLAGYLARGGSAADATGRRRPPDEADGTDDGGASVAGQPRLEVGYAEAPVPLCVVDRELRVVRMNRRMADLAGRDPTEPLGSRIQDVLPVVAERVEPHLRRVFDDAETLRNVEISPRLGRDDGLEGAWRMHARPMHDQSGGTVAASVALEDVSEEVRSRRRLRRNLGSLRSAVRAAPYPVTLATEDGEVLELSRSLLDLTGHSRGALRTLDRWLDTLFGSDRDRAEEWLEAVLTGDADPARGEWPIRTKSGTVRIWDFTPIPLDPLPDGRPVVLLTALDVTERKRGLERMRLLADAGAVLTEVRDPDEVLAAVTERMVRTVADFAIAYLRTGDSALRRVAQAHRDPEKEELLAALEERAPLDEEHPLVRRLFETGEAMLLRPVREEGLARDERHARLLRRLEPTTGVAVPMMGRDEPLGAFGVFTTREGRPAFDEEDRTTIAEIARRTGVTLDNERLQREERRAREEAEVANVAKSQFLSVVSHELRTPLNGIMGNASILEEGIPGELNARQRDHVRRIRAAAGHLASLIDEILTYSKAEAGKEEVRPSMVDLAALAGEVAELLEPRAATKNLHLHVATLEEGVELRTDAGKVRQILLNLVGNAVKFTDRGEVVIRVVRDDDAVEVRVRDTGPGVPGDAREKIFEPFVQVDQSRTRTKGGTGLGLAVAARQAELIGGEIDVDEAPGGGSVFRLRIPRGDGDGPLPDERAPASRWASGGSGPSAGPGSGSDGG